MNDGEDLSMNMNQLVDLILRRVIGEWMQLMMINTGVGSEADGRAGERLRQKHRTWLQTWQKHDTSQLSYHKILQESFWNYLNYTNSLCWSGIIRPLLSKLTSPVFICYISPDCSVKQSAICQSQHWHTERLNDIVRHFWRSGTG